MTDIVITGATGVVGRRAVEVLLSAGHRVTGVARSARAEQLLGALGARVRTADVFDVDSLTAAFAGADVVVNLLTHIPPAGRMADPAAWEENDRLRRDASAAIARAAQTAGAGRLIQESLAFLYADGGARWLDEQAPIEPGRTTATALVAEQAALRSFGGESVVLRFGLFIGPDSSLTLDSIESARRGISPTLGRRAGYWPSLWLDDAATAVAAALEAPAGVYNVVDDDPPTRGQADAALAAAVAREALRPVLDEIPELFEPVARSQRVSNRRLRETTGWAPRVRGGIDGWGLITTLPTAA